MIRITSDDMSAIHEIGIVYCFLSCGTPSVYTTHIKMAMLDKENEVVRCLTI